MGRTYHTRSINPIGVYDRTFFKKLFEQLECSNFSEVTVILPHTSKSPSKSLSPGGFLEVTEKLDGICVIAVNKLLPGDMFEFVIARSSPQALFPNVTWANPPRHQSFIGVMSFDAARPYALTGYFVEFIAQHARSLPSAYSLIIVAGFLFISFELMFRLSRRHLLFESIGWTAIADVLALVIAGSLFFASLTAPTGVVLHNRRSFFWLLRNVHEEPYRSNPWVKFCFTVVALTVSGVLVALIVSALSKPNRPVDKRTLPDSAQVSH